MQKRQLFQFQFIYNLIEFINCVIINTDTPCVRLYFTALLQNNVTRRTPHLHNNPYFNNQIDSEYKCVNLQCFSKIYDVWFRNIYNLLYKQIDILSA